MGNSESNTPKTKNNNIPIKPAIKKTRVPNPVNGYYYYPPQNIPEQYAHPVYPANYPVVSNENYLQNEFYPRPATKNKALNQPDPTNHHNHDHRSHHHHHHDQHISYGNDHYHGHHHDQHRSYGHHHHNHHHDQHRSYGHHHHNHHHHQYRSALPSEKERLNPPILTERATSPSLSSTLPSVQAQKPVSSIITYKLRSPVASKELKSPSSLPVRQLPSVIAKKSPTAILPGKLSTPVVVNQHQFSQSRDIPSFSTTSNTFEKAPIIEINYVPKSSSSHSLHEYGPGTMSIVQRNSSKFITPGNRWYDHDYDKRIKPLTVNDV